MVFTLSNLNQRVSIVYAMQSFSSDYTDFTSSVLSSYNESENISFYSLDFDPYRIPYIYPPVPKPFKTEKELNHPVQIVYHPMEVFPSCLVRGREGPSSIPWGNISMFVRGYKIYTQIFYTGRYTGAPLRSIEQENVDAVKLSIEKTIFACILLGKKITEIDSKEIDFEVTKLYDSVKFKPCVRTLDNFISKFLGTDNTNFETIFNHVKNFKKDGIEKEVVVEDVACSSTDKVSLEDRIDKLEKTVTYANYREC